MSKILKKQFLTVLLLIPFLSLQMAAQKSDKTRDYTKYPYWIEMIKDSSVNYFEAVKAYDSFWKGKEKPMDEDELIGQEKKSGEKEVKGKKARKLKEEKELYAKYALDCKKFEHWKLQVKPYIQADGRILTKEERLKIWEEQKQNRKN